MKKLFITSAVLIGTIVSALPVRTSCGMVMYISDSFVANATPQALDYTISQLNFNVCGVFPTRIIYYTSNSN